MCIRDRYQRRVRGGCKEAMADWKKEESFDLKGWQKVRKARKKLAQSYKTDKRTRDGGVAPSLYADSLSKGLAVHPLSVFDNRITAVNLFNAIMSVTSVAVGIIQIEVQWSETEVTPASSRAVPDVYVPSNNSALVSLLQWINLFQCALLGIGVYRYYFLVLAKQQARGLVLSTEGLYEAGLLPTYLVETFLCVLCPPPGFSTVITWHGTGDFITKYHTNDLIVVMMLPRMFQVYRCFLDLYGLTSVSLHDVGKMYHVDVDSVYMTKVLFKRSPFKVLGFFTVFMLTVFAFAISIFERPSDLDFQYFRNCLWVAIVTWTTVGFGDVYPTTDFGRAAASLCCATSLFNLALLVMAVQDTFRMNTPENLVLATYETRRCNLQGASRVRVRVRMG
eukprot:TRINITY_DN901_c0_g1_i6.p1 TRINITY_DN901_c0_g1~~TRINITY_DN901_c0_g1_i6.p1  ORF type:complete len:392 (-),score=77.83 TRINITY_DN901_c0_g1_i6:38-1213(-)